MTIHFLLTPDSCSARRLRRLVAEQEAHTEVVVGTWSGLVALAAESYMVPSKEGVWEENVGRTIQNMPDMFWSSSLEVAESETIRVVTTSLRMLLEGITPGIDLSKAGTSSCSDRADRHYHDFVKLHKEIQKALPDNLTVIQSILEQSADYVLRLVHVYYLDGLPRLNPWQLALVEKLNGDCIDSPDPALENILHEIIPAIDMRNPVNATEVIASRLFDPDSAPVSLDQSVQWLGVRDYLEEAEVACGIIQEKLKSDPSFAWRDFSLLVPADNAYTWAIREVFSKAGLPLSGLPDEARVQDLGREAILYFILCRRRPAPNMALAALVTSPLMPWPGAVGHQIAQEIMGGHYDFEFTEQADKAWKRVWQLIRKSEEKPAKLKMAIKEFASLLNADDEVADHNARARGIAEAAGLVLQSAKVVPWDELLATVSPENLSASGEVETTQEGIAVFTEHNEPWRKTKRLLVLGFNEGRYPAAPARSPVFFDEDITVLKAESGLDIQTQVDILQERRGLFKRQLSSAEEIVFLVPRKDGLGGNLTPSQSLPFMARLFEDVDEPGKLIHDLEKDTDREKIVGIATAAEGLPVMPRVKDVSNLQLGFDLVMLRTDKEGAARPQSPSRLGTLMTSPFAWVLGSVGITARDWEPEELSVAEKGTLAHDVFEHLFAAGKNLPSEKRIETSVNRLLNESIIRICPYMLAPEWITERKNLEGEIITAALAWRRLLKVAKAKVVEVEPWIRGSFDGLPIHGKADAILSLDGGNILVVDYKKSSSGARREQMRKGYDSQTSLYRTMLQTGVQDECFQIIPRLGFSTICSMTRQLLQTPPAGWAARWPVSRRWVRIFRSTPSL